MGQKYPGLSGKFAQKYVNIGEGSEREKKNKRRQDYCRRLHIGKDEVFFTISFHASFPYKSFIIVTNSIFIPVGMF